jgi:hypothetical protein
MRLTDIVAFGFIGLIVGVVLGELYKYYYPVEPEPVEQVCPCGESEEIATFRDELQMLVEDHQAMHQLMKDPLQLYVKKPVPKPPRF